MELNVTPTVETGVAHPLGAAVDVGFVVDVEVLLVVGGVEPPDPLPVILMSAQVRYICGVWKEFHLSDKSVWLLV